MFATYVLVVEKEFLSFEWTVILWNTVLDAVQWLMQIQI